MLQSSLWFRRWVLQRTLIGITRFFRLALIMSTSYKRKRDEYETSDDENEYVMGKQALPVANLPFDFEGVPEDGAQYLFTVRCLMVFDRRSIIPLVLTDSSRADVMRVCFLILQGLTIRMQHQKRW